MRIKMFKLFKESILVDKKSNNIKVRNTQNVSNNLVSKISELILIYHICNFGINILKYLV